MELPTEERTWLEGELSAACGRPVKLSRVEALAGRSHVARLHTRDGDTAVLKRRADSDRHWFGRELASLRFLNEMPEAVAPRLLAEDADAGLLVVEDLGDHASLADSLLSGDRRTAQAHLAAYATALATVHAWSIPRIDEFNGLLACYAADLPPACRFLDLIEESRSAFAQAASELGVATGGVDGDVEELLSVLGSGPYVGFVHGDLCPDNVSMHPDGCRIFDFEHSGRGSIALDAVNLRAPFPSCWCFAGLPSTEAESALATYRDRLRDAGVVTTGDWDQATAAALGAWVIVRSGAVTEALHEDHVWGTTSMRPRLLAWTEAFVAAAERADTLSNLRHAVKEISERLRAAWPEVTVPGYPAFAAPESDVVTPPDWWQPTAPA